MIDDPIRALIAAMRSGDYQQTMIKLRTNQDTGPAYCAVGLLCELVRQDEPERYQWRTQYVPLEGMAVAFADNRTGSADAYILPSSIASRLDTQQHALLSWAISLNDRGEPFSAIADFLEEHYEAPIRTREPSLAAG